MGLISFEEFQRRSYSGSKKAVNEHMVFMAIFRHVSKYVSYPLFLLRIPANAVTLVGILLYVFGCYLLIQGVQDEMLRGALIINLGMFFDLVDGEIARASGPTKLGGFLDLQHSVIINTLLLPSAAIGLYRMSGEGALHILYVGFFGALGLAVFNNLFEIASKHFKYRKDVTGDNSRIRNIIGAQFSPDYFDVSRAGKRILIFRENLYSTTGILLPCLFIAVYLNKLSWFIYFYAVSFILIYLFSILLTVVLLGAKKIKIGDIEFKESGID